MKVLYRSNDSSQLFEINVKEHVIWKNEVIARAVRQKIIETQIITNLRVLQNNSYYFLHTLDDIVVMNRHRESQHRHHDTDCQRSANSHSLETRTMGDVVFIYRGRPVIVFKQIIDPYSFSTLAKNTRINLLSLLRIAEGNIAATKVQNRALKIPRRPKAYRMKRMGDESSVSTLLKCRECAVPLVNNSNFCNSCGSKVSFLCSNCNHKNHPGSGFCNNCGLPLT